MLLGMPSNRTLVVMRHAKSSWKTGEPDVRRPLSGRGTRDAVVAGGLLAGHAPDVVWCSPATRARQTWQCAVLGGASTADLRIADDLYAAWGSTLLDVLRGTPGAARSAVLIAHEPGVSELVSSLAVHSALRDLVDEHFPTSAMAFLGFAGDWDELAPGICQLTAFEIPRG